MHMQIKAIGVLLTLLVAMTAHAKTTVELGLTGVMQTMNKDKEKVEKENTGSVDLTLDMDVGYGLLHVYVEAGSDITGSVSTLVDGTNLDAGTALDANGQGRAQLSEISYQGELEGYDFAIGVQNLFRFADVNSTSNSETDHFLAASLVNNPTIEAPDYTASVVLRQNQDQMIQGTFILANAYGLSDNASADYNDLVHFGNTPEGLKKGLFGLGEFRMFDQGMWLSVGRWRTTQEAEPLSGSYVNLDSAEDPSFAWSLRLGKNDNEKTFASFSTSFANGDDALGVGISMQKFDALASGKEKITLLETYYRWQIAEAWSITPDVQVWGNANGLTETDTVAGTMGGKVTVYGIRLQYGDAASF